MQNAEWKEKAAKMLEQFKPALQRDGGDVELLEITDDGIVKVRLQGACHSCPMSQMTLKMGIEFQMKKEIPEIKEVINI